MHQKHTISSVYTEKGKQLLLTQFERIYLKMDKLLESFRGNLLRASC